MARARLPRFQGRMARTGRTTASATMNGVKARSKKGGADRDLAPGEDLGEQRPDGAEEDDEGGDDEQQVVDDEAALAADGGEDRAGAQDRARARRRASASRR